MLKKSVDLHLKMIRNEIIGSAVALAIFGVMLIFAPILMIFAFFIPLIVLCVYSIKGTTKLFGRSLYGEESELYHSLPLTTRELLLSKAVVMILWQAVLMVIMIVILLGVIIAAYLSGNNVMMMDAFEGIIDQLLEEGLTPVQMGVLISLVFFALLISEAAYCMFLVAVQIAIRRIAPGIAAKMSDLASILTAGMIFSGITFSVKYLEELVPVPEGAMFYIVIGKYLLLAGIAAVLYYFCRDNMEKTFEYKYLTR